MTKLFTGTLTQIVIPTPELWGEESADCSYRKKQISRRIPSASLLRILHPVKVANVAPCKGRVLCTLS